MKIAYSLMLKQLQHELNGMDGRRQALQATIEGLKRLVEADVQPDLTGLQVSGEAPHANGKPVVPPGFFLGKTVTEAYRDLHKLWPGEYTPPKIVDAFVAGGMKGKTRTEILQAVHSVRKRERAKVERNGNGNGHSAD